MTCYFEDFEKSMFVS